MLKDIPKDRVLNGLEWKKFNQTLKENRSALPAVCVSSPSTANAAMAAAAQVNSPIIILTSFGAGHFNAGKSLPKTPEVWAAGAASKEILRPIN